MENLAAIIVSFLIILLGSVTQGVIAFGFALVAAPLLLLFLPTLEAVTTTVVLACAINILMIRDERPSIIWQEAGWLLPGAAVGALTGMLFLRSFAGPLFKAFVAATFLFISITLLAARHWRAGNNIWLKQAIGFTGGVLMGSTSMGGPPAVLYLTGRGLHKSALRGTLAVYLLATNVFALTAFFLGGIFDTGFVLRSLLLVLAVVPGFAVGRSLASRLNSRAFRRLVLIGMAMISFVEVVINLKGYF